MSDNIWEIGNRTMVPASLIVAAWFGIDWLLGIKNQTDQNALAVTDQKSNHEKIIDKIEKNNERLARIEESIIYIKERLK